MKEQIKKLMLRLKKSFREVYNALINNSKIADAPGTSKVAKAAKAAKTKPTGGGAVDN